MRYLIHTRDKTATGNWKWATNYTPEKKTPHWANRNHLTDHERSYNSNFGRSRYNRFLGLFWLTNEQLHAMWKTIDAEVNYTILCKSWNAILKWSGQPCRTTVDAELKYTILREPWKAIHTWQWGVWPLATSHGNGQ